MKDVRFSVLAREKLLPECFKEFVRIFRFDVWIGFFHDPQQIIETLVRNGRFRRQERFDITFRLVLTISSFDAFVILPYL